MPSRILIQPNGMYARFSTIVDDFTHYNMTKDEALDVCFEEMGRYEAEKKVARAEENGKNFDDEIDTIRVVHGNDEAERTRRYLSTAPEQDE